MEEKKLNLDEWDGTETEIERVEVVTMNTKWIAGHELKNVVPQKKIVFYTKPLFEHKGNKYYAMMSYPIIQKGDKWTENMDFYKLLKRFGLSNLVREFEYSQAPLRKRFIGMKVQIKKIPYRSHGWLAFKWLEESNDN